MHGGGSAGWQLLLGSCLAMECRDQMHWLDLKSCCPPCPVTRRLAGLDGKRLWICSQAGLWALLLLTGAVAGMETQFLCRRGAGQSYAPHLPLPVPRLPSRHPITRGPCLLYNTPLLAGAPAGWAGGGAGGL